MKILFISRAYPPVIGGIENQNAGIAKYLGKIADVTVLANTRGKKFLPFFLPYAFFKALLLTRKHDAVLLGDGVLSPLGALLSVIYPKKKFASIIHGLDITYAQKKSLMGTAYRFVNIPSLKLLDELIMVGNETIDRAVEAGINRKRCVFIPNGIEPEDICEDHSREELEKLLKMHLDGKLIILRVGRYVQHKGVEWFIRNVVPKLPEHIMFVAAGAVVHKKTAGDENYFPLCKKAIKELGLENRVKLLTNLAWSEMKILFNTADIVVSPNIPVPGSMEGFGINAIEAAACARPVIASNFEGLKDAIKDGENGILVKPKEPQAWVDMITDLAQDTDRRKRLGEKARRYTIKHYAWQNIAKQYLEVLNHGRKK